MTITSEPVFGRAVMTVLANEPDGEATVRTLIDKIPQHLNLTVEDHAPSLIRDGEELWEQRVRNLKSHDYISGNVIHDGFVEHVSRGVYRLTPAGRMELKKQTTA